MKSPYVSVTRVMFILFSVAVNIHRAAFLLEKQSYLGGGKTVYL